jgi:hypothetical protein
MDIDEWYLLNTIKSNHPIVIGPTSNIRILETVGEIDIFNIYIYDHSLT